MKQHPNSEDELDRETQPTLGFNVLQRAVFHAISWKTEVTGANVLAAIFSDKKVRLFTFASKNITRLDVD